MLAFLLELWAPLQFDQSMLHLCRFYKGNKKANNQDPQKPIFRWRNINNNNNNATGRKFHNRIIITNLIFQIFQLNWNFSVKMWVFCLFVPKFFPFTIYCENWFLWTYYYFWETVQAHNTWKRVGAFDTQSKSESWKLQGCCISCSERPWIRQLLVVCSLLNMKMIITVGVAHYQICPFLLSVQ